MNTFQHITFQPFDLLDFLPLLLEAAGQARGKLTPPPQPDRRACIAREKEDKP